MPELVIPARFNGPPRSGNGGWVSGRLASLTGAGRGEAVRVVLRSPPPLDVRIRLQTDDGGLSAWDGDTLVARASRVASPFTTAAPEPVAWTVAQSAASSYAGRVHHPFPTCFTCGPSRPPGDGLHLTPGALVDRPGDTACAWTPDASLSRGAGLVSTAACWAALDCPGGWSVDLVGRPMVLGTMTAQLNGDLPAVGRRHVVIGRALDEQGRKAFTETALYALADDGTPALLARATAVWIRVDLDADHPA